MKSGKKAGMGIPKATPPAGGKQTSGKVRHERAGGMNIAGKGENLKGMPKGR